jgi:hypothetical protein
MDSRLEKTGSFFSSSFRTSAFFSILLTTSDFPLSTSIVNFTSRVSPVARLRRSRGCWRRRAGISSWPVTVAFAVSPKSNKKASIAPSNFVIESSSIFSDTPGKPVTMSFCLCTALVGDELGKVLGEALGDTLGVALGEALGVALGEVLGDALGLVLGMELGDELGLVLGAALGAVLGVELGDELGLVLGLALGAVLGEVLGDPLGLVLGLELGDELLLGDAVLVGMALGS